MACPIINSYKWGLIEVDGVCYSDVKIYPTGAENWDWLKTDTRHDPGIRTQDVQDLLDQQCSFIILSRGLHRRLDVDFETYKLLLKCDVDFLVTDTSGAIDRYRKAVQEGYLVGALIHTKD